MNRRNHIKTQQSVIFGKKNWKINMWKNKNIVKLEITVIIQENKSVGQRICNLRNSVPKNIPRVFRNGRNYDYLFHLKRVSRRVWKTIYCLGKNTEKHITFSVPKEKEVTRIDKNGENITKCISYRSQFTDHARFMATLISILPNNLSERIHTFKSKYGHHNKKYKTSNIKYKYCNDSPKNINFKDDLIEYKCLCFKKNYQSRKVKGNIFECIQIF